MLKQKKGQGLSISTIIIVIICLIVLVVIIAIFTGKLGNFSKGVESTVTCANSCKAFGRDNIYTDKTKAECEAAVNAQYVPGQYGDITGADKVCCCQANS